MVETHNVEFADDDIDGQKIVFFDGKYHEIEDVHIGNYDFRFNFNDKKYFSINSENVVTIRIHTEPRINQVWLLLENPELNPIEMKKIGDTERFIYWEIAIPLESESFKFSFAGINDKNAGIYFGTSGIANFISPSEKWVFNKDDFLIHEIPDWVFGGVMYQIFPDRFCNSKEELNKEGTVPWGSVPKRLEHQGGDLYGVIDKLDYLKDLGVNIVYLNPIFLSTSIHRYDTWDHKKVDPTLGGDDALRELVDKAHEKEMKIILDCSLNHFHPQNYAFQDVIKNEGKSEYADWFTVYDYPVRLKYRPHLLSKTHKVGWDGEEDQYKTYLEDITFKETNLEVEIVEDDGPIIEPTFKAWWGVPDMVKVDMTSEGARKWALDVARYWVKEFNIDGWRMDVAKELDFSFWKDFRNIAYETKKDVLLISEIFGDTSQWLQGDRFDGTMNYSFRETMTDYFATKRINNKEFADSLANLYSMYSFEALSSCQNLLSSHDVKRFLNRCGNNEDGILGAIFLQATFPGIAGVYYGDEVGLGGADDPFNREPFPWHNEESWNKTILEFTKTMMQIKNVNPIFKYGRFELLDYMEDVVIFRRILQDESLICVVNRDRSTNDIVIPSNAHSIDVVYGDCEANLEDGSVKITKNAGDIGIILHEK
mgnify:CR=1 FL=1